MDSFYYLNIIWKNNIIQGSLILLFSIILASLVDYLIWYYVKRVTNKTINYVDDFLVNIFMSTVHWFILVIGFKQALLKFFNYNIAVQANLYYKIALVILIAYIVARSLAFSIGYWLKSQKKTTKIPQYVSNIVGVIVFLIALMIILSILKISITPILTSLGIAGLVVGLSLQNTLTDFIAGIKIISEEKVKVGDFIDDGQSIKGVVEDMSLNSVKIRNLNNNIVVVPNNKISSSPIINYVKSHNRIRLVIPVIITTKIPVREAKQRIQDIVEEVFNNTDGVNKSQKPEVWLTEIGQKTSISLPILTFNILINVNSYKYQFSVTDTILTKISEELWDDGEK